jgi:hypothetical protein
MPIPRIAFKLRIATYGRPYLLTQVSCENPFKDGPMLRQMVPEEFRICFVLSFEPSIKSVQPSRVVPMAHAERILIRPASGGMGPQLFQHRLLSLCRRCFEIGPRTGPPRLGKPEPRRREREAMADHNWHTAGQMPALRK